VKRTTLSALLLPVALTAVIAPFALARSSGGPAHTAATSVGVTGKEFKFVLTRSSATHGTVSFRFTNKGRLKHDFKIAGKKTPILSPGRSATLKVSLRTGRYKYICTVSGHAAAGMKGYFRAR
jgi:nitrite reductase (NO-forming)